MPADAVIICAGPWTGQVVKDLLGASAGPGLNVEGSRAHSIVVRTKEPLTAHALFTSMTLADGSAGEPEVYARPDGGCRAVTAVANVPLIDKHRPWQARPTCPFTGAVSTHTVCLPRT